MLDEINRFMKSMLQAQQQISEWIGSGALGEGPKVVVYDQNKVVKLLIEAPGMNPKSLERWAIRVGGQSVYIRGHYEEAMQIRAEGKAYYSERREDSFMKMVPLPYPVQPFPQSVKLRDGVVTVVFERRRNRQHGDWIPLEARV